MDIQPFRIDVADAVLDDLRERLAKTRWPSTTVPDDWNHGTNPAYLRALCDYWMRDYDWRKHEARLNGFRQFKAQVGDTGIHFIHEKGKGDAPIPLLLVHGWPDSFARFLTIIPMLTDPAAHGAGHLPSFDVVVPSLPGYAWSDPARKDGATFRYADLLHALMVDGLGYRRFGMHGGDWGSTVTEHMARSHASSVIGIHLTDIPFFHSFNKPDDVSLAERHYLKEMEGFQQRQGAYALIQSTKPATLAVGLNDSPAGLAAWIVEKLHAWTDNGGDLGSVIPRDDILTLVTIYWVTQTIGSSFQPYYDFGNAGALRWIAETFKGWIGSDRVPAAFAKFPKDLSSPPREWAERFFNVQRWTDMPRGGHFAAMEQPALLADDLRATFAALTRR